MSFLSNCFQKKQDGIPVLEETITSNDFQDNNLNPKLSSLQSKLRIFPMLIVPSAVQYNYEFIYLKDSSVTFPIKSLILSQNQKIFTKLNCSQKKLNQLFHQTSLNGLKANDQQNKMFQILFQLSGNHKFNDFDDIVQDVPALQKYKLTLDNFFKMCLIILRRSSLIPSIIMGESGVGKTALIQFLAKSVFQERIFIFNVNAGTDQKKLQQWVKLFIDQANCLKYLKLIQLQKKQEKYLKNLQNKILQLKKELTNNAEKQKKSQQNKIKSMIQKFQQKILQIINSQKLTSNQVNNQKKYIQETVLNKILQQNKVQLQKKKQKEKKREKNKNKNKKQNKQQQKQQKKQQQQQLKIKQTVWVFFDEFNTTDELNYIKQIVIDRRFQGEKLPDNIFFLAACNPYRKKKNVGKQIKAGIKKNHQDNANSLAFLVKPPTLSMIQLMWDYSQLGQNQNKVYIQNMLSDIKYNKKELLLNSIVFTHEQYKKKEQISSVSLRDVARFKQLFDWFLNLVSNRPNQKDKNQFEKKAAVLAFIFCYVLRLPTNSKRQIFLDAIQKKMNFKIGQMKSILIKEQQYYVSQFKLKGQNIAYNSALMENIFTSFVCIMNKIPILIIGNPGSSKSLSIKMLSSSLKGLSSQSQFCKQMYQILMIYYQGSQSSTSAGLQQILEKGKNLIINKQKFNKNTFFQKIIIYSIDLPFLNKKIQFYKNQKLFKL